MIPNVPGGLRLRLVAAFAAVLAVTLLIAGLFLNNVTADAADRFGRETDAYRVARLKEIVAGRLGDGGARLQQTLERAAVFYGRRLRIYGSDGSLLADSHSGSDADVVESAAVRIELASGGEGAAILEISNAALHGAREPEAGNIASAVNRSLIVAGVVGLAGGISAAALLTARILGPVRQLRTAAIRLGRGDLEQRVTARGNDEIGDLGRSFNAMARDLQRAETQRRRMVSDIAHELRTPLSNIQGYLEAFEDGVIEPLPPATTAAVGQVKLLDRLIEDLQLITLVDSGDLALELRTESLAPIVRSAVEPFRPRALARAVALESSMPTNLPAVDVDVTRITQVLGILIENALQRTPVRGQRPACNFSLGREDSGFSRQYRLQYSGGGAGKHLRAVLPRRPLAVARQRRFWTGPDHSQGHRAGARWAYMGRERGEVRVSIHDRTPAETRARRLTAGCLSFSMRQMRPKTLSARQGAAPIKNRVVSRGCGRARVIEGFGVPATLAGTPSSSSAPWPWNNRPAKSRGRTLMHGLSEGLALTPAPTIRCELDSVAA